ncbi:MAG: TonB-dependent receptor [Bacteroidetes bacterium]|nr:MAG: TonB-dependent receptor [Bacteroidota bacterium]TAG90118.1 MAG: TonB-dependent receptor [Bacteroidota bacterium]
MIFQQIFAQTTSQDSILTLEEVKIFAQQIPKFAIGANIKNIDSNTIFNNQSENLGELLMRQTGIYFKQYGGGMLSTPSFRGTGASHTAVLWNGININSLSLGQSDFSAFLVGSFQNIEIQAGGNSALYGSDALGGSIHLGSQVDFSNKKKISMAQQFGSFGQRMTNLQTIFSNKKIESKTNFYQQKSLNNFSFSNRTIRNFPIETQNNAGFQTTGFQQELNFKMSSQKYISLKSWYQERHLEIQPTMNANQDKNSYTHQFESNLRIVLDFVDNNSNRNILLKLAYIDDKYTYQSSSQTNTKRGIFQTKYETNLSSKISLQTGINTIFIATDVASYAKSYQEIRSDIFALLHYQYQKNFKISLNTRQAFINEIIAPFSPSLGFEYQSQTKQKWIISGLFSRNFRFPTLNDRYWNPGGNINLRPENSWSSEISLGYVYQSYSKNWTIKPKVTAYKMWVNDWILWQNNGNIWSPQNLRKVQSSGIENELDMVYQHQKIAFSLKLGYHFTKSINIENENSNNPQFHLKQLPYTPFHRFFSQFDIQTKNFNAGINFNYTGLRFENLDNTNDILGSIPAFFLINFHCHKNFEFKKHTFGIGFKINNVLDKDYQNYLFRAMQGRNFQITFHYKF